MFNLTYQNICFFRAGRESYGDNAIGHVQVKREGSICIVKARVTPEHNVRKQPYAVTLVCREANEEIISVQCADCAASSGISNKFFTFY